MTTQTPDAGTAQVETDAPRRVAEMDVLSPFPKDAPRLAPAEYSLAALLQTASELYGNGELVHAAALLRYVLAYRCQAPSVWAALRACHLASGQEQYAELLELAEQQLKDLACSRTATTSQGGGGS
jgi:uncharacterized protein YjiS (DUF1127 family)